MRLWLAPLLAASCLLSGCATWAGKPPPCPAPPDAAIEGVVNLQSDGSDSYAPLLYWIGEMERYCSSLMEMIDN